MKNVKKRAVALISGGLDSTLSALIIKKQGVEVYGLHFAHAFNASIESFLLENINGKALENLMASDKYAVELNNVMKQVGIPLQTEQITGKIVELLRNPKYGFGKHMNPCIDCRIMQFIHAKSYMEKIGADFLITGEVVGQRPMSQMKNTIRLIEKQAGLDGLIVRPLSAKVLPESIPEKKGWIQRESLYGINGRGRKTQKILAKSLGIMEYPESAGGCRLTYEGFARKMKDLVKYKDPDANDTFLLQVGRHFRTSKYGKAVVGKNAEENGMLKKFACEGDILIEVFDGKGPTVLLRDKNSDLDLILAACLCVSHAELNGQPYKPVHYWEHGSNRMSVRQVAPLEKEQIEKMRI